ncbi:MAG TPA: hypothetical protein VK762_06840, partial [Polyangiaceae bacterium]|nr:hypothetical protein [Polyangiaceae bacterium]
VLESSSLLESGVSPGGLELLLPQAASKVSRQEGPTTASRLLAFMNVLGAGLGIRRLAGLRPGVPASAGGHEETNSRPSSNVEAKIPSRGATLGVVRDEEVKGT